jgi:hypothetical protein
MRIFFAPLCIFCPHPGPSAPSEFAFWVWFLLIPVHINYIQ